MDTPIVPTKVNTVFEGRVFTVQVESITLPKGHTLDAEIVRDRKSTRLNSSH